MGRIGLEGAVLEGDRDDEVGNRRNATTKGAPSASVSEAARF